MSTSIWNSIKTRYDKIGGCGKAQIMVIIPVEWFNNKVGIFEVLQTFKSNVKVITELRVNGE